VNEELERIAGRVSVAPRSAPKLSPNLTALLGGFLGLTTLASLGLVFQRVRPEAQELTAEPAPSATTALPSPTPAPERPARTKEPGPWRIADESKAPGLTTITGSFGKQSFLKAIEAAGLTRSEAYRVYAALRTIKNLDRTQASDKFVALLNRADKRVIAFEYLVSVEEVYQVRSAKEGEPLAAAKLDLKVGRNQIRRGLVFDGTSFEESAKRAGFDPGLRAVLEKALLGHLPLSSLKAGDQLRVIAQEVTVLGDFARYSGVEALELLRDGKPSERIYYFSHPTQGGYFDATGRAPFEGGYRKPIPGAPVTSKFNPKRMHPVLKKIMPHTGTDFGCSMGMPIGATSPGKVTFIGNGGPSGNLVKVEHEGGIESGYAHLSRFAEKLSVGDNVDRLQLVGYCGSTGRSTGPHLHFTIKKNGQFIDAESMNLDGMRVLPGSEKAAFSELRAKYDPVLDAIVVPSLPAPVTATESPQPGVVDPALAEPSEVEESASAPTTSPAPTTNTNKPTMPSPAATPATPAKVAPGGALFLTNEELLKMQSRGDDGEVTE
jgi:murein DD-endopeptidase MepM/ murein hydrolase activator NlpD